VWQDFEMKLRCAAHHEAGHVVIAAAQKLKLRPEGISVDASGCGLACYWKQLDASDLSRERVIVASLAGFKAEERLRKESSYPALDPLGVILSPDAREAREQILKLSAGDISNENPNSILAKLENRSECLVKVHWLAIQALATALLDKDVEPLKPLKSGGTWSRENETTAKYVKGEEVVSILERYGIAAVCDPDVDT